jgi:ParB-like chromosome segregation protein Spo0J
MNKTAHPYADMFPMMQSVEHSNLVADMKAHGFDIKTPIILFGGQILDGRNRYKAANDAGIEALFSDFEGTDEQALNFVIRHNLHRRHLSETQRAVVASRLANMSHGGDRKTSDNQAANLPLEPMTQSKAADMLNVGDRTVRTVKAVERNAPELVAQMESGAITANEATKIAKLDIEQRDEIMAAVNAGEGTATKILKSKQIESARLVMGSIDLDPASSEIAQTNVNATVFYSIAKLRPAVG